MSDTITRSVVTNTVVGEDLGLDHSMVSRLRTGQRNPSFDTMQKIAKVFGWTIEEQAAARAKGPHNYAFEFEELLGECYSEKL